VSAFTHRAQRAALAALFCSSITFPSSAPAQSDRPVLPRPDVKVGDSWTYQRLGRKSNQPGRNTTRVTFVNDRVINTLTGKEQDATWTTDWNQVAARSGNVYMPHQGLLRFPLRVGDSYPVVFEMRAPRAGTGESHAKHESTATVVGWEEVEVPAGKFRALKVEIAGTFHRIDAGFSGSAKHVIWYVPEVKRWVKWTWEGSTPRGSYNWSGEELLIYNLN